MRARTTNAASESGSGSARGIQVVARHGVDQILREVPVRGERSAELRVGESEDRRLRLREADLLSHGERGRRHQFPRAVLIEGQPADVVQHTRGERLVHVTPVGLRQHLGEHPDGDGEPPEALWIGVSRAIGQRVDHARRERRRAYGSEAEQHDRVADRGDLPRVSVVGGVREPAQFGGQRLIGRDDLRQLVRGNCSPPAISITRAATAGSARSSAISLMRRSSSGGPRRRDELSAHQSCHNHRQASRLPVGADPEARHVWVGSSARGAWR